MVKGRTLKLPPRFQGAKLDDLEAGAREKADELLARLDAAERTQKREYIQGSGYAATGETVVTPTGIPGLVLVGPVGCGKTHAAAAIAKAIPGDVPVKFKSALEIVEEAKIRVGANERPNPLEYERFDGVLILDDLSAIRPTDFALDTLTRIIRVRYDEMLCTIVTTHSGQEDLAQLYGTAIASRMLEFGPIVKLEGADRRRQKAQA